MYIHAFVILQAIIYGPSIIPSPLFYLVKHFGSNIIGDTRPTDNTFLTIELPPVHSVVSVSVSAVNAFGTGPTSDVAGDIISKLQFLIIIFLL